MRALVVQRLVHDSSSVMAIMIPSCYKACWSEVLRNSSWVPKLNARQRT